MEDYSRQWNENRRKEKQLIKKRSKAKENFINRKISGKVPETLGSALNTAFVKAFEIIFEKGSQYVERTYNKEEMIKAHKEALKPCANGEDGTDGIFEIKAENYGAVHTILSGASGVGMGAVGAGIPDIPVFIGMMLRGIYQISLNYGYSYESKEEKIWILMLIKGGLCHGDELIKINRELNLWIQHKEERVPLLEEQIEDTATALSKELLYSKFLQGIPIVGAAGGFYDAVYMSQVLEYAKLKYQLRYIYDKK